jgi:hypothetical protein
MPAKKVPTAEASTDFKKSFMVLGGRRESLGVPIYVRMASFRQLKANDFSLFPLDAVRGGG